MNDQQLLEVLATTDRYPASRPLPTGWADDAQDAPPETQGSETMSTIDKARALEAESTPSEPNRWRRGIAALVIIVLAVAAIVIVNRDSSDVIETPTTTTDPTADAEPTTRLAVAESVVDAFYSFNAQQLVDRIGDASGSSEMVRYQEFLDALNVTVASRQPCTEPGSGVAFCGATVDGDIPRALGYQASHGFRFEFQSSSSIEIIQVTFMINTPPAVVDDFQRWIEEIHPDVFEVDCTGDGPVADDPTRCALALSSRTAEFVASDAYTGQP